MIDSHSDFKKEFEAFREECVWCVNIFNTHFALFENSTEVTETLKNTAIWFFHDYSVISQEYAAILIGRLTENHGSGKKINLSSQYVVKRLKEFSACSCEIESVHQELREYANFTLVSRNKLVAHRDRETILAAYEPNSWPAEEVHKFLKNLNKFCDLVALKIGMQPLDFLASNQKGDAYDLIRAIKKAQI